ELDCVACLCPRLDRLRWGEAPRTVGGRGVRDAEELEDAVGGPPAHGPCGRGHDRDNRRGHAARALQNRANGAYGTARTERVATAARLRRRRPSPPLREPWPAC